MINYEWSDFPVCSSAVHVESRVGPLSRVIALLDGLRYVELHDNGWQLLLGWVAGPSRVVRVRDHSQDNTSVDPRAAEELDPFLRENLNEDPVNEYLAQADTPPRPVGWQWFLWLPGHLTVTDVWRAVDTREEQLLEEKGTRIMWPSISKQAMLGAIEELYTSPR